MFILKYQNKHSISGTVTNKTFWSFCFYVIFWYECLRDWSADKMNSIFFFILYDYIFVCMLSPFDCTVGVQQPGVYTVLYTGQCRGKSVMFSLSRTTEPDGESLLCEGNVPSLPPSHVIKASSPLTSIEYLFKHQDPMTGKSSLSFLHCRGSEKWALNVTNNFDSNCYIIGKL